MKAELMYSENGLTVEGIRLRPETDQEQSIARAVAAGDVTLLGPWGSGVVMEFAPNICLSVHSTSPALAPSQVEPQK